MPFMVHSRCHEMIFFFFLIRLHTLVVLQTSYDCVSGFAVELHILASFVCGDAQIMMYDLLYLALDLLLPMAA